MDERERSNNYYFENWKKEMNACDSKIIMAFSVKKEGGFQCYSVTHTKGEMIEILQTVLDRIKNQEPTKTYWNKS
jgi:hypothetical protein